MSPERHSSNLDIWKESLKIRDWGIAAQDKIEVAAREEQALLVESSRDDLGYDPAEEVDPDLLAKLVDTRIEDKFSVINPELLASRLPITQNSALTTYKNRVAVEDIVKHKDNRAVVIVGPCSISDPYAALEYAKKVKEWRELFGDDLEIVMRFYIEKPRTEKGWKGLVYDPLLDESDDIDLGVTVSRALACRITDMGVPLATERLNANTPQYLNGLITYDAIGARNAEDQKAREYASGTSSVTGQKHAQNGDVTTAVQAVVSANAPHSFLGVDELGMMAKVTTKGNDTAHIILRGGNGKPNYTPKHIAKAKEAIMNASNPNIPVSMLIDASHANSGKKAKNQIKVIRSMAKQIALGETAIIGAMIESNLVEGAQKLRDKEDNLIPAKELKYGKSITDECVGLDETELMLSILSKAVQKRRLVMSKNGIY